MLGKGQHRGWSQPATADAPGATMEVARRGYLGNKVELLVDRRRRGSASPAGRSETLRSARVLIVVAGMEGALPSVVGGLVDKR